VETVKRIKGRVLANELKHNLTNKRDQISASQLRSHVPATFA
jgi:hypothetical protein